MGSNADPIVSKPWIRTPLIRSTALSKIAGCNIFLKLENLQPSGSFKSRGIGQLILSTISSSPPSSLPLHFYSSSAGNAGLACAHACLALSLPCTIIVPETTTPLIIRKLRDVDAEVVVRGRHWKEADSWLRENCLGEGEGEGRRERGVYVPPFDDAEVWRGNGGVVDEIEEAFSLMGGGMGYDGLVCSVGGGGLFCGLMGSLERFGRLDGEGGRRKVRVLAVETRGADSLAESVRMGERVRLEGITSIATSLGATMVCEKAFAWAAGRREVVDCLVLEDGEAAMACVRFLGDERMAVEVSCGVGLAVVYGGYLRGVFKVGVEGGISEEEFRGLNVVAVVCGGNNVSLEVLDGYEKLYGGKDVEGAC